MQKYIFMAVAGMLALSSCSNDDNDIQDVQNAPRQMTFTAGYNEGAQTRATMDFSTKKVTFDANDKISVFSKSVTTNAQFTTSAGTTAGSATFTGSTADDTEYYAVYPYKSGMTHASGTSVIGNVQIPSIQNAAATNGWDPAAAIAYATTTGSTLTFHNACALLKIHNDRGDNATINITDMGYGAMAGTFSLDTSTGTLTKQENKSSSVSASGVPNNTTIYLAIAPGTFNGFTAEYNGSYSRMKVSAITFEKGKIYNLGNTSSW